MCVYERGAGEGRGRPITHKSLDGEKGRDRDELRRGRLPNGREGGREKGEAPALPEICKPAAWLAAPSPHSGERNRLVAPAEEGRVESQDIG